MRLGPPRHAVLGLLVALVVIVLAPRAVGAPVGAAGEAGGSGITGVVVDGLGAPLVGATVGVTVDGSPSRVYVTDSQGRYRASLPAGSYGVSSQAPDQHPGKQYQVDSGIDRHAVLADQWVTVDFQIFAGTTLTGRVVDAAGQPLEGARVLAAGVDPFSISYPHGPPAQTDADGRYTIDDVRPGRYVISASHDGFRSGLMPDADVEADATVFRVVDDHPVALADTELRVPGTISGRIVADGFVWPLGVTLYDRDDAGALRKAPLELADGMRPDGSFEIVDVAPGRYWLRMGSENYGEFWQDAPDVVSSDPIDVAPGQQVALGTSVLRPGVIRGSLTTSDDTGVADAPVAVQRLDGSQWTTISQLKTDWYGDYEVGELMPGRYRVCFFEGVGRCGDLVEAVVTFNGPPVRADGRRRGPGTISGTVTRPDGTPAAGVNVVPFTRDDRGRWESARTYPDGFRVGTTTGPTGTYRMAKPAGVYRIGVAQAPRLDTVAYAGGSTSVDTARDVRVVAESTTRADVVLARPGRVTGTITGADGRPVAGATVSLQATSIEWDTPRALTDTAGRYVITHVHPGRYRVVANDRALLPEVYPDLPLEVAGLRAGELVEVAAGETVRGVDFRLTSGSTLRTSFRSRTADRVADADVQLFWRGASRWVAVDRDLARDQSRLPAGRYRLAYRIGLASGAQVAVGFGREAAQPRPDGRSIVLDGVHTRRVRSVVDARGVLSGLIRRAGPATRVVVDRRASGRWRTVTVIRDHRTATGAVYATPRLDPGRYRLRLSGPLRFPATIEATVTRSRHVRRDVVMPGHTWSGRIFAAQVGAVVSAVTPVGAVAARTRVVPGSDEGTTFTVGPLRRGERYALGVHDPTGQVEDFYLGPADYTGTGRYFDAVMVVSLADAQFRTVSTDVPWAEYNGSAGPGAVLHGRLLRPDGTPWARQRVELLGLLPGGEPEIAGETRTTSRGFWRFDAHPQGVYRLRYLVAESDTEQPVSQVDGGCRPQDGRPIDLRRTHGYVDAGAIRVAVVPAALRPVVVPWLSGTPTVGSVLTASPGVWRPCEVATSTQWLRDGRIVAGAVGPTYQVQEADRGHRLSARVVVVLGDQAAPNGPVTAYVTGESLIV